MAALTRFNHPERACRGEEAHGVDVRGKKSNDKSEWIVDRLKGSKCCARCIFRGVGGVATRHCKRTSCIVGPYCWQHTRVVYGVQVKESTIADAGNGLFATKAFARGDLIVPYRGEVYRNEREMERATSTNTAASKDMTAVYTISLADGSFINPYQTNSTPARYANHKESIARGGRLRRRNGANAEFFEGEDGEVWLQAIVAIAAGSEIFVDYGPGYWDALQETEEHETADVLPAIGKWYKLPRARDRKLREARRYLQNVRNPRHFRRRHMPIVLQALWNIGVLPANLEFNSFFDVSSIQRNVQVKKKIFELVSHIVEL